MVVSGSLNSWGSVAFFTPPEGKDYKWYISGIYCQLGDYMPPPIKGTRNSYWNKRGERRCITGVFAHRQWLEIQARRFLGKTGRFCWRFGNLNHSKLGLLWFLLFVSLTSRDLIHQRNLEKSPKMYQTIGKMFGDFITCINNVCKQKNDQILFPKTTLPSDSRPKILPHSFFHPKKTHQIPTSLPPFFAKQKNKYLQTPDQNGSQRNQVSCCCFFCACKISSRSCCLGSGEEWLKDPPCRPGPLEGSSEDPFGRGTTLFRGQRDHHDPWLLTTYESWDDPPSREKSSKQFTMSPSMYCIFTYMNGWFCCGVNVGKYRSGVIILEYPR